LTKVAAAENSHSGGWALIIINVAVQILTAVTVDNWTGLEIAAAPDFDARIQGEYV
jgi:hypothetical protein